MNCLVIKRFGCLAIISSKFGDQVATSVVGGEDNENAWVKRIWTYD